ncbi:MAG: hypothetical protein MZV70_03585 [Desulfobacterales bacterium]|nr:hypothetical protein [Desulfobacterales bacterium]
MGDMRGRKMPTAVTVTELSGYVVGGSDCDFNVEERSACNSAGTDINATELTADANGGQAPRLPTPQSRRTLSCGLM